MGDHNLHALNAQCQQGQETFLFIASREGKSYRLFKGTVEAVSGVKPKNTRHLVPEYYTKQICNSATFWAKLNHLEETDPTFLDRMHVASSGQTVSEMFDRTRTAMILVRMGTGIAW